MSQRRITSFFKPTDNIETNCASYSECKSSRVDESKLIKEDRNQLISQDESMQPQDIKSMSQGKDALKFESSPMEESCSKNINNLEDDSGDIVSKYNPAQTNYDPVKDAFWGKNDTPYIALAKTFLIIEDISGRLKMVETLSNFFTSVILLNPNDLLPCIYLSINQLGPIYEGLELGVAEKTLLKVICSTTGRDLNHIKSKADKIGDLGIVAEQSRIAQRMMIRPKPLTVNILFQKLKKIASIPPHAKYNVIQEIFVSCRSFEARYFIRSLMGKLRIGVAEQSLLQALATAVVKSRSYPNNLSGNIFKKEVEDVAITLKNVYCQCPNYSKIIPSLLSHGIEDLSKNCIMEPGIPLKPMLAQPTKSIGEILNRFEGHLIACEFKYDGERAQVHWKEPNFSKIYSRNQEDITLKYPDITEQINCLKKKEINSFIIDCEVVAWDGPNQQILPFQELSKRKRKNVNIDNIKVKVCLYIFDLLYLNGESLTTKTFFERRELLRQHFHEVDNYCKFPGGIDTTNTDDIQQCLDDSIKNSCEGLMIKTLHVDATYEISKRSRNWLKLKKDYISNIGDSLDLVVIGGYKGRGKRTGWFGGYLLACYDEDTEEYQSICKLGTGFSDEELQSHSEFFQKYIINSPKLYYRFTNGLQPDVWFEPIQVWEIKCADFSLSPVHMAGIGIIDPERGISLRFPRFVRIRNDKKCEEATSAQQVANMYSSQVQIKNNKDSIENEFY